MNESSYRPTYHASVPRGWANDPNGMIYWRGKAHLFYQHHPHRPEWGAMYWGHFVTEDFVRWESLPIALSPDEDYEAVHGCFSGTAVDVNDQLWLFYTASRPDAQRQCLAVSDDGISFRKDPENPLVAAGDLSPALSVREFRDPCVFRHGEGWYMLAGTRVQGAAGDSPAEGFGNVALLASDDLRHWRYVGPLLHAQPELNPAYFHLDGVYECPDFVEVNGAQALIVSPQRLPQMGHAHQNLHGAVCMLGALDFDTGAFHIDSIEDLDSGFDFYAAQTLRMPDGRAILIAWKEMWDRSFPTRSEGWAGTFTLPRELRVEGGVLMQRPVRELEAYRRDPVHRDALIVDGEREVDGISGRTIELNLTLRPGESMRAGVRLFRGPEHETLLYYERATGLLVFDRSRAGIPITGREPDVNRRVCELGPKEAVRLRIFLDISSVEVFVDGGRHVMTGNVYPDPGDTGVTFFAEGGPCRFDGIEKYDIVVE